MQNPRDQGHALLHRLCLLALIFVWFWISLDLWEGWELSLITLPWNYAMVAMAGLLVATFGSLQNYGSFYIKNGWQRVRESFNKANFQSSLIAFFVFASYFATKDNETSRLFLAFYIVICSPILLGANFALPGVFKRVIGFRGPKMPHKLKMILDSRPVCMNNLAYCPQAGRQHFRYHSSPTIFPME